VRKFSTEELLGPQRSGYGVARPIVRWREGQLHRIGRGGESVAFQRIEWDEWPRVRARFSYRLRGGRIYSSQTVREVRELGPHGFEFHAGGVAYRLVEETEE